MPLGNHTYSHINLNKTPPEQFLEDVALNETVLKELAPTWNYHWFRYPFLHEGDTASKHDFVRKALLNRGYKIAQVTIDFEDWAWNDAYVRCHDKNDLKSIAWLRDSYINNAMDRLHHAAELAEVLFGRPMNHILLLHIGIFDSMMIDRLLSEYRNAGVTFITLAQASSDLAFKTDPKHRKDPGWNFLHGVAAERKIPLPPVPELPLKKLADICGR